MLSSVSDTSTGILEVSYKGVLGVDVNHEMYSWITQDLNLQTSIPGVPDPASIDSPVQGIHTHMDYTYLYLPLPV